MSSHILFAFDLQLVIASNCCDDLSPREWEPQQEQFATDESPTAAAFIDQSLFNSFTSFIEMQLRKGHTSHDSGWILPAIRFELGMARRKAWMLPLRYAAPLTSIQAHSVDLAGQQSSYINYARAGRGSEFFCFNEVFGDGSTNM